MDNHSKVAIGDYLAGASIAFGMVLLVDQACSAYYGYSNLAGGCLMVEGAILPFVGLHTLSGWLSGYFIGRRSADRFIQTAVVTTVVAYMFEVIYYSVLIGSFEGSTWALVSLMFGGVMGSLFARVQKERRRLALNTAKQKES